MGYVKFSTSAKKSSLRRRGDGHLLGLAVSDAEDSRHSATSVRDQLASLAVPGRPRPDRHHAGTRVRSPLGVIWWLS